MTISQQNLITKILIVISIVTLPLLIIDLINFSVDDVFIPLRVAQNLVHGNGMVYNAGEYVEGHSNPIWVLALAGLMKILPVYSDPMYMLWIAKILSVVFGIGTIGLTYFVVQKYFKGNPNASLYGTISVFLLATSGFFIAWSVSGMETVMASFLYLMAVFVLSDPLCESHNGRGFHGSDISRSTHVWLLCILFIAALCRPEAPLFSGFIYSYVFLVSSNKARTIVYGVLPYIVMLSVIIAWRYSVYYDVFPNTYYAKTGTSFASIIVGLKYLIVSVAGLLGPMFIIIPVSFFSKRTRTDPYWLFLGLILLMDKKIAHDRKNLLPFDVDYIFLRAPDYIILFKHIFNPISFFGNQNEYDVISNDPRFKD